MQADSLKLIADTAVKAAGNRVIKPAAEPAHVYYMLDSIGEPERFEAAPPPADHAARDLTAIAAKAAEHAGTASEVWFDRHGVVCLFDRGTRRDRVALTLDPSGPLQRLYEWDENGGANVGQVELYQLIRTTFAGCLDAHPDLRKQVGKVDIKKAQQAAGTVDVGKASLSRSMIAEASGADKLPDVLVFDVPVFDTPKLPIRAKVRVAFDLDPQTERFRLVPLPGEVEAAFVAGEDYTQARLHDALAEIDGGDKVPTFYGRPG